jgi:hypothetical protein
MSSGMLLRIIDSGGQTIYRFKLDTNHGIRINIMPPSSVRNDKPGKLQVANLLADRRLLPRLTFFS